MNCVQEQGDNISSRCSLRLRIYLHFFLRNEGVPKEYTLMGISTLYARVIYLFLSICNKLHEVHLDNIYMSAKFAQLSYTHNNCVKVQGLCRTGSRLIPREVLQTDFQNKKLPY